VSTFRLRACEDEDAPIGDVPQPRVAEFAFSNAIFCDLAGFGDQWVKAADHVLTKAPGGMAEIAQGRKAILLSIKDEETAEQFLEGGLAFKDQQIPMMRQFEASKELAQVYVSELPECTPVQMTKALIEAFSPFGRVVDTTMCVVGKDLRMTRHGVVTINTGTASEDSRPDSLEVRGRTALLRWQDCEKRCSYCRLSGHHIRVCPALSKKAKREEAPRKQVKAGAGEMPAPPSKASKEAGTSARPTGKLPAGATRAGAATQPAAVTKAVGIVPTAEFTFKPKEIRVRRSQRQRQAIGHTKVVETSPTASPSSSSTSGGRKRRRRASEDCQPADMLKEAQPGPPPSAGLADANMADCGFDAAPVGIAPPNTITLLAKDPLHSDPNGLHLRHMKATVDQASQQPADPLPATATPQPSSSRPASPEAGDPDMVDAMESDIDESASAEESLSAPPVPTAAAPSYL
jgi:hypothetical protein